MQVLIWKSTIKGEGSIAMFDYQMVFEDSSHFVIWNQISEVIFFGGYLLDNRLYCIHKML